MKRYSLVIVLLCVLGASSAMADKVVTAEGDVVVRAALGKALEIDVESGVGDLVRSGDPLTLKVEHTAGHLFVTPLTTTPADLVVIDTLGRSYRIKYVFDQGFDERVVITGARSDGDLDNDQDAAMALMRDLIRGRASAGAVAKESHVVMFDNGLVRMRAVMIHELPQLVGYILEIENLKEYPVMVPLQQITLFGLLAIASEKDILAEWEKTKAYMVIRR